MSRRRWQRDGETSRLSAHLGAVLPKPEGDAPLVRQRWEDAVGSALSRRTKVDGLKAGILQIVADDANWKTEVEHLVPAILPRLVQSGLHVIEIRVRLA